MTRYPLRVAPNAERTLARLPERVAIAIVELMVGTLLDAPHRVGGPLTRSLTGLWSARRGAYRILYEINDATRIVRVVRVDHRADVYRAR